MFEVQPLEISLLKKLVFSVNYFIPLISFPSKKHPKIFSTFFFNSDVIHVLKRLVKKKKKFRNIQRYGKFQNFFDKALPLKWCCNSFIKNSVIFEILKFCSTVVFFAPESDSLLYSFIIPRFERIGRGVKIFYNFCLRVKCRKSWISSSSKIGPTYLKIWWIIFFR